MEFISYLFSGDCDGGPYCFVIAAALIVGGLYIYDNLVNSSSTCRNYPLDNKVAVYGYDGCNGPACWPQIYLAAGGSSQSPINLKTRCAMVIPTETVTPLSFSSAYQTPPYEMKLYNNGHNVVIYATWNGGKPPKLSGGPINEEYTFHNIRFRWGPNDSEGSEHMVDSTRYAMEVQAFFIKSASVHKDVLQAARYGSLLILSYLFMVTPQDNPFLEPIVTSLQYVRHPTNCVSIEPIILSLLLPDFSRDYYMYVGSLTFPPCTEGVIWIVKPEPLLISAKQVRKFRKLRGYSSYSITSNTRPVQKINSRDIYYYD